MRNGECTMVDAPGTIVFATATLAVQRSLTFGVLETVGPGVACMRAPREGSGFAVVYARVLAAYVSARPVFLHQNACKWYLYALSCAQTQMMSDAGALRSQKTYK